MSAEITPDGADAASSAEVGPLGIIAGAGALPRRIIEAQKAAGRKVFVIGFEGQTDPRTLVDVPSLSLPLGAAGRLIDGFRNAGVEALVMAGRVSRPRLSELKPDLKGAQILTGLVGKSLGDDGLLRHLADILEKEGFRVLGVPDVLHGALAPNGHIAGPVLPRALEENLEFGLAMAREIGRLDIGQAVVLGAGRIIGVEAAEGTDELCRRMVSLVTDAGPAALFKAAKPQQDRRLDLPAIGPGTVSAAAEGGLSAIIVEADAVLMIEHEELVAEAQRQSITVYGAS